MARTKVDNKLNVVIGTKAQVEADNTIPDNSIVIVTDEELTASDIPNLDAGKITTGTFVDARIPTLAISKVTNLQSSLDNKVDKIVGKGLSTNDYTTTEKNKLAGIASGAEVNVQSDWTQEVNTADDYIKNKPAIPTKTSDLTNDTGYITGYTETDPIFTAWNKSTGITITKSQVSDLIEATQALSGLMSATDKQRLDVLHALLEEDTENSVVDSINEVLAIFNNYPEGADLVTALAGKVDKVTGKGLSTNDYTNTDKQSVEKIPTIEQDILDLESDKVDKVSGMGLSSNDYTTTEKNKLSGIQAGAQVNAVTTVAGRTGAVVLTKADVGLGSVQNYAIASKTQAESGTSNELYMTPLRTKELITVVMGDIESALDAILGV